MIPPLKFRHINICFVQVKTKPTDRSELVQPASLSEEELMMHLNKQLPFLHKLYMSCINIKDGESRPEKLLGMLGIEWTEEQADTVIDFLFRHFNTDVNTSIMIARFVLGYAFMCIIASANDMSVPEVCKVLDITTELDSAMMIVRDGI